jgi:hypothetical protein
MLFCQDALRSRCGRDVIGEEATLNRSDAIQRLISSRAEWDALVSLVPENRRNLAAWEGGWSIKDLIAHVDSYEWWSGEFFIKRDWPVVDQSLNTWDVDARNNALYELNKYRTYEEIVAESPALHGHLIRALEQMTDAEFEDPEILGQGANEDFRVESLLADGSWNHYEQHRADVERILKSST